MNTSAGYLTTILGIDEVDGAWDDLRFPAQGINPPGQASDPDLDGDTGLWLFAAGGTEILAGVAQLPHAWVEGSTLKPHVHWQKSTSAEGDVLWRLDYEALANGAVAAMDYGTQIENATSVPGLPDLDTANQLLITAIGDVAMTGLVGSCIIFWKLSRIGGDAADTYGADARLIELDFHYQSDSLGSKQEIPT